MTEVCILLDRHGHILWADAGTSPTALPDSRARWDAIWANRDVLDAIAHSHPVGPSSFSEEDLSTMAAIDAALGRELRYMVVAPRAVVTRSGDATTPLDPEPWWADLLRLASGMRKDT